jgi:hypothetical protein
MTHTNIKLIDITALVNSLIIGRIKNMLKQFKGKFREK